MRLILSFFSERHLHMARSIGKPGFGVVDFIAEQRFDRARAENRQSIRYGAPSIALSIFTLATRLIPVLIITLLGGWLTEAPLWTVIFFMVSWYFFIHRYQGSWKATLLSWAAGLVVGVAGFVNLSIIVAVLVWAVFTWIHDGPDMKKVRFTTGPVKKERIREELTKEVEAIRRGVDIGDTTFSYGEGMLVRGVLGEEQAAKELEKLSVDTDVIHGLEIFENGHLKTDIDHLVLSLKGTVMVESVVWRETPVYKHLIDDPEYLEGPNNWREDTWYTEPNSPNWEIISQVITKSRYLPTALDAIIISVTGTATEAEFGTRLMGPRRMTHYIDDNTFLGPFPCPLPVYVVDQRDLVEICQEAMAGRVTSPDALLRDSRVRVKGQ
ncbi:nuclease-related domain-containing protein [Corynebacterium glutamicum]|uniref:nuclease-related domain-containing protein n=1 Tax=Corynebacterium glutamicum TaxID=1718 RepID=UPI0009BFF96E|nr:nuclease-related domain-containing protein [Corynebacterium glutamicum]